MQGLRAYVRLSVCLYVSVIVCMSVRPIIRPPQTTAAGLLLWAYAANASSVTLSADVGRCTQSCYTSFSRVAYNDSGLQDTHNFMALLIIVLYLVLHDPLKSTAHNSTTVPA